MKNSFWSTHSGCGVTANLAAISVAALHQIQKKTFIMENHFSHNNLSKYLIPTCTDYICERDAYYVGHGAGACLSQYLERKTNKRKTESNAIELIEEALFYLPQNRLSLDCFDYEFLQYRYPLIEQYEGNGQLVFVDTKAKESITTKMIIDSADVVVVNLNQDDLMMQQFFLQYSCILEKTFFVLGCYQSGRGLTQKIVQKKFNIPAERIGIIPYNEEFQYALAEGRTIEFINRHMKCTEINMNYYFIQELQRTTSKLLRFSRQREYKEMCINPFCRGEYQEVSSY